MMAAEGLISAVLKRECRRMVSKTVLEDPEDAEGHLHLQS